MKDLDAQKQETQDAESVRLLEFASVDGCTRDDVEPVLDNNVENLSPGSLTISLFTLPFIAQVLKLVSYDMTPRRTSTLIYASPHYRFQRMISKWLKGNLSL